MKVYLQGLYRKSYASTAEEWVNDGEVFGYSLVFRSGRLAKEEVEEINHMIRVESFMRF